MNLKPKEMILAEEAEYPSAIFADSLSGDGYTAFYFDESDECKELHEGNHAIIYPDKIKNLGKILDEIKELYAEKHIEAAIFHPLGDEYYNYFNDNRAVIEKCGYEITLESDYQFMTLSGENTINAIKKNNSLDIKLLDSWDNRIASDIILPCGERHELESTKKFASLVPKGNNFLFVGFVGEKAVVYSTIHKSKKYDCVRFDYILCSEEYRGKGYGSEMVSYIVDFCHERGYNNCFQWSGPSDKIVRRAGFCDAFTARSGRMNIKQS